MKNFGGKVLFLDRSDINTDEIIPAKYLNESAREALKLNLLEDLKLAGFDPKRDITGKGVVVSRANFGCGSSREHAPWALEVNGINLVIAESFARIFRQNMYNCGMIAAELPAPTLADLFRDFKNVETALTVDIGTDRRSADQRSEGTLTFSGGGKTKTLPFVLTDFEKALVEAGGWVEYAAAHY
ncbi:3-isopropylmalate dehydratase small subunit [Spirochaetia bacterium]|nr:3-isopropylmalate dehydratase small subunit [Spirochaetia bacterium]